MAIIGITASSILKVRAHRLDSIFASGELGAIYDANRTATLWQNTAKTIPVLNDGDPVRVWSDLRGGAFDLVAPSDGERPLWFSNLGEAYLEFNGVKGLRYSEAGLNFAQPSFHAVVNRDPTTSFNTYVASFPNPTSFSRVHFWVDPSASLECRLNGVAYTTSANSFLSSIKARIGVSPSLGNLYILPSVFARTVVDPITYPSNQGLTVGYNSGLATQKFVGRIHGVTVYNRATSAGDITALQSWNP